MSLLNKSQAKVSSRSQINIKEVKDGILVLPKSEYCLIIETSSVNFELKSEAEQDVLIDNFQNFLNSLPTQLQILIRVREVDIDSYVERIMQTRDQEKQTVYKEQIDYYCDFIRTLVSGNKILSRRFYVIVPYRSIDRHEDFRLIKEHLNLSRDIIVKGLEKLGMKTNLLNSLEILNLFYSLYNSDHFKTQPLEGSTIEALLKNSYA